MKDNRRSFLRFFTVASFSWLCILLPTMNTIWKHDNPLIIENDNYNWYQNYSCIILEWVRSQRQRYIIQNNINRNWPFEIHSFCGMNSIRINFEGSYFGSSSQFKFFFFNPQKFCCWKRISILQRKKSSFSCNCLVSRFCSFIVLR